MTAITMDISRLIGRAHHQAPTGIDRFELQYARWARARSSHFVETGPSTPIPVRAGRATGLIAELSERWSGSTRQSLQASQLERIYDAIDARTAWTELAPAIQTQPQWLPEWRKTVGKTIRAFSPGFSTSANASLVHVSHTNLDRPAAFSWLDTKRSRGVFYVHDLIPLTHPEFVRKKEPERHLRRMETVLRHAGLVLCNSRTTARSLRAFAEERGRQVPEICVLPPGIEDHFRTVRRAASSRTEHPYFLVVGTIEPRKNHIMLLQLWRTLIERDGAAAPRLVIVGKRGWENAQVFATLDRCPPLRNMVIETADLGDAALAELMSGASALLAPSFVEGYGMPVAEAMAVGIPLIISDIPSHREIAPDHAVFLDPSDGLGWRAAIEAHAREPRAGRRAFPLGWQAHFETLDGLMETMA